MRILIFNEKHGNRYFLLNCEQGTEQETEQLQKISLKVFQERDEDFWYEPEELTPTQLRYYQKAKEGNAKAALTLLNSRQNAEYESFDIVDSEEI